jgi:Rad3-related DNA helicase
MSILNHAPVGFQLRDYQQKVLLEVEAKWDKTDVMVIDSPVGSGKSLLSMTIANWCNSSQTSAVVTTPRVALQDQYLRDWPNLPTLKGMAHYHCKDMDTDCASAYEILEERCNNCPYSKAKDRVIAAPTGLYNIHSCIFLYNGRNPNTPKLKDVIIIDEAHTLFSTLSGMYEISLWKHLENYPDEMETIGDVHAFLQRRIRELENEVESLKGGSTNDKKEAIKIKQKVDKFYRIMDGISKSPSNFFIQKDQEMYYGRMRDLLKIRPQDLSGLPPLLWGSKQKIVLMTGTWNAQDIKMLGLGNKRVTTVFVDNPIPPEQRPIVIPQGLNMSREYQDKNLPAMAKLIDEIRKQHDSKGVVHITYPLAEKLSKYLNGSNYLYHTADNSSEVLQQFLSSKDKVVMVACGMTTGLDLVGEDYQWQVIAKIPYPSLGDPLVRKWLQDSPDWYRWLSVSLVLQAVGRICRGPKDYGVTYILDNTAGTLDGKRLGLLKRAGSMIPKYFKEAVKYE